MKSVIRDGSYDIAIVSGTGVRQWPSVGVKTLSTLCADAGLMVGALGGNTIQTRGILPFSSTGGIVFAEDAQKRIHRIRTRAIVRFSNADPMPDPFTGWNSERLIPIATARELLPSLNQYLEAGIVILGTSNGALQFGAELIDHGRVPFVTCIERELRGTAKEYAGWEVFKRRFEIAGGKIVQAEVQELSKTGDNRWSLRLKDQMGIRLLDVSWVIAECSMGHRDSLREYPPGSFLFEIEQTSSPFPSQDIEGWELEQANAIVLAAKLIKGLALEIDPQKKEALERISRRARTKLKFARDHLSNPFSLGYEGKWTRQADREFISKFAGVPQSVFQSRAVASLECFENISCTLCEEHCPESAIKIIRKPNEKAEFLIESKCTGCGICVAICPAQAAVLVEEKPHEALARISMPSRRQLIPQKGNTIELLNRRGETLGSARVMGSSEQEFPGLPNPNRHVRLIDIEVPSHLTWETRGFRATAPKDAVDTAFKSALMREEEETPKVDITLDGSVRYAKTGISVSRALFEMGRNRFADSLFCPDGSCGLCRVEIDGTNKLACTANVHKAMVVKTLEPFGAPTESGGGLQICPCLHITREMVVEKIKGGGLSTVEAILSAVPVGAGLCHGRICMGPFLRILEAQGVSVAQWIDWRFPWTEWVIAAS